MRPTEGFEAFYAAAYPRLVRQFVAITADRQDAEDLVQEGLARAAVLWDRVGALDAPEAWVRRVALNLARNEFRRFTRSVAALGRLRQEPPRHEAAPSSERSALVQALRRLPRRYREVLVLHSLVDLSVEQVATELRLPVGTVTARLTRGRRALSGLLDDAGMAGEERVPDGR